VTDNTGQFGYVSTLQIQRALSLSDIPDDERRYENVAGGVLGENREYSTTLERGVRYRLVVANQQGEQRQLGSIVPERPRVFNLQITGLDFTGDTAGAGAVINTSSEVSGSGASKTKTLTFALIDETNETTSVEGDIHERGDPSNQLTSFSASASDLPAGTFVFKTTVSGADANTSWVANYSYSRLGEQSSGVKPFAGNRFDVDFPLEAGWQSIFGVGLLMMLAGVFSVSNARIGALIIPGAALLLFQLGFLSGTVSLLGIGLAFSVAVGYNLAVNSGSLVRP
jgi:hypothetical protein